MRALSLSLSVGKQPPAVSLRETKSRVESTRDSEPAGHITPATRVSRLFRETRRILKDFEPSVFIFARRLDGGDRTRPNEIRVTFFELDLCNVLEEEGRGDNSDPLIVH